MQCSHRHLPTLPTPMSPLHRAAGGTATHLLGAVGCHTDRIQEAALREGAYFSGDVPRLYSTIEARACLRGKRVVFAGDSHCKQLFIGLVDVLQGEPSNVEIHSSRERNMHLEVAEATAASFLQQMGIHVSWNCSAGRTSAPRVVLRKHWRPRRVQAVPQRDQRDVQGVVYHRPPHHDAGQSRVCKGEATGVRNYKGRKREQEIGVHNVLLLLVKRKF